MNALILIDVQNDFLPGGALAVRDGDQILPVINRIAPNFDLVLATQDWHPPTHASFAANHPGKRPGDQITLAGLPQILWPTHCVQGTPGADFSPLLDTRPIEAIFRKGTDPTIDSYSGLFDNGRRKSTGLAGYLRERGVTDLYVCGLATDYCVKYTAIDAVAEGFTVHLIPDACRGVNLSLNDVDNAIAEMKSKGISIITERELVR